MDPIRLGINSDEFSAIPDTEKVAMVLSELYDKRRNRSPGSTVMGTFNSINPRKPSMLCWSTLVFRENVWANDMYAYC